MISITIDEGVVTPYELHALSLSQIMVLAALRRLKTIQRVAKFLRRDERAIEMVILRIQEKGIMA